MGTLTQSAPPSRASGEGNPGVKREQQASAARKTEMRSGMIPVSRSIIAAVRSAESARQSRSVPAEYPWLRQQRSHSRAFAVSTAG